MYDVDFGFNSSSITVTKSWLKERHWKHYLPSCRRRPVGCFTFCVCPGCPNMVWRHTKVYEVFLQIKVKYNTTDDRTAQFWFLGILPERLRYPLFVEIYLWGENTCNMLQLVSPISHHRLQYTKLNRMRKKIENHHLGKILFPHFSF